MSSVCSGRTRFQTSAAIGDFMSSKRTKTGPGPVPGGKPQTGLFGKLSKNARSSAWPSGRRGRAVALVQQHQRAVLQVVDPVLRDERVVGAVDARRDRAGAGRVEVLARGRRAVGVGHLGADRDVAVAHVRLDVARLRRGARRRATRSGPGRTGSSRRRPAGPPRRTRRRRRARRRAAPRPPMIRAR